MRIIILHQLRIIDHRYWFRERVLSKLSQQIGRPIGRRWRDRINIKRIKYNVIIEEIEE